MDDITEKLNSLLSDSESVRQLSELAEMMNSKSDKKNDETSAPKTDTEDIPDIGKLIELTGVISSASGDDKNTELLLALRPHLSEERQKKLDKAVRMLKIMTILSAAKENGLLDDLI